MDAAPTKNRNPSNCTALSLRVGGGLTLSTSAEQCTACSHALRATASTPDVDGNEESIVVIDMNCDDCGTHQRYRIRSMPGAWSAIDIEVGDRWQTKALIDGDLRDQINRDTASLVNDAHQGQGGCV